MPTVRDTARQQRFVDEYMKDRNATQAAIRAGYAAKNADVTGPRLLGNVGIKAEIDRRMEEYTRTAGITAVWLLEKAKTLVDFDIRKLFDEHGKLLHPTRWPDDGLQREGRRAECRALDSE